MISDFKTLADYFIKLAESREKEEAKIVSEIIDPMFKSAKSIATEYYKIIHLAKREVESKEPSKLAETVRELEGIRAGYLAERQSVAANAEAVLANLKNSIHREFAAEVLRIFFDGETEGLLSPRFDVTQGQDTISALRCYISGGLTYGEITNGLMNTSRCVKLNLDELSGVYARIKIARRK